MDMGAMVMAVLQRWMRIALVTGALLAVTFVVLMFVPKLYESSADILVESRQNAFTRAANDVLTGTGIADEFAVASQIELIKSRDTLLAVIDTENLRDEPEFNGSRTSPIGMIFRLFGSSSTNQGLDETVLKKVSNKLKVIQERDSRLISISFRSEDPVLAARIANAIADTHVRRRSDLNLTDAADATQWLAAEIEKLRTRVAEAEVKVASYRVDNDLFAGANDVSLLDQQLSDISAQITATQERENSARSRATLIRGLLDAGQPIDGVSDVRESVVVQQLSEDKARLQGERAQRLATLLPDHPDILALSAQIVEIDKQILAEGRQVADALEAEAKIEGNLETSLRDELTRLKIDASTATKDTVTLTELEREATAQRDLLETYLLRFRDASARTEVGSAPPDVRVVSMAAPANIPASPKTALILAAVFIVSIMLQLGQILFAELVSGRAIIESRPANRAQPEPAPFQMSDDDEVAFEAEQEPEAPRQVAPRPRAAPPPQLAGNRPVRAMKPRPAPKPVPTQPVDDLRDISAGLIRGQNQLVLVTALDDLKASRQLIESITGDLVGSGRSVVEVDAGSRQTTRNLGISDLCVDEANFGDVVHRGKRTDFALVPWGQQPVLQFGSPKCMTLVGALTDIFETVIVDTGRVGVSSSLPSFGGAYALVMLVTTSNAEKREVARAEEDLRALGFNNIQIVTLPANRARVA